MGFSVENGGFLLKYGVNMVFLLVFNRFPGKMGENNPSWGPLEGLGPLISGAQTTSEGPLVC